MPTPCDDSRCDAPARFPANARAKSLGRHFQFKGKNKSNYSRIASAHNDPLIFLYKFRALLFCICPFHGFRVEWRSQCYTTGQQDNHPYPSARAKTPPASLRVDCVCTWDSRTSLEAPLGPKVLSHVISATTGTSLVTLDTVRLSCLPLASSL